jgi:rod shape-determining protein MreC
VAPPRRNRRPRTTLVVLVLASITIITLDARGGFHRISSGARSAASDAFAPVRSGVDDIIEPIGNFLAGAVHYGALRQQNERLQQQLDQLNMERGSQSYVQQSLTQLKQLSKLYNLPCACNLQPVAAEVTDYGSSNFAATIDIGVGRGDGVDVGMPVVGGGGLVGQVVEAGHHTATVRLITDGQSVVDAVYGPSPGSLAEIDGQGSGKPLAGNLIPPNKPVKVGEQFVTSGLQGGEFPGGIPVATVTSAETGLTSSQETVTLRPTADLQHLRYVEVLIWGPPT